MTNREDVRAVRDEPHLSANSRSVGAEILHASNLSRRPCDRDRQSIGRHGDNRSLPKPQLRSRGDLPSQCLNRIHQFTTLTVRA